MLLLHLISGQLSIQFFLLFLFSLVMSIAIHEFSHALVATKLGDPTAKVLGRLTLNPISHLDLFGTLALLFIGIGWGKPVPFNPNNLSNPKLGSALISAAGPISNLILALIMSIPYLILINSNPSTQTLRAAVDIYSFAYFIISLNAALAVFNLIPVHPLDGFKVLGGFLPKVWYYDWSRMEKYGMFILLLLIIPINGKSIIGQVVLPLSEKITNFLLPNLALLISVS